MEVYFKKSRELRKGELDRYRKTAEPPNDHLTYLVYENKKGAGIRYRGVNLDDLVYPKRDGEKFWKKNWKLLIRDLGKAIDELARKDMVHADPYPRNITFDGEGFSLIDYGKVKGRGCIDYPIELWLANLVKRSKIGCCQLSISKLSIEEAAPIKSTKKKVDNCIQKVMPNISRI